MGNTYFVGWDVGSWNCSNGSMDAFAVFRECGGKTKFCFATWGNMSEYIVGKKENKDALQSFFSQIFEKKCDVNEGCESIRLATDDRFIIGIDAVLKWPKAFVELLTEHKLPQRNEKYRDVYESLTFRQTELRMKNSPLSAVRDSIGSHSTKALYFLEKYDFKPDQDDMHTAIWRSGENIAFETYPAPLHKKEKGSAGGEGEYIFKKYADRISDLISEKCTSDDNAPKKNKDIIDSILCAMIAKMMWDKLSGHGDHKDALMSPSGDEIENAKNEGWIWLPKECYKQVT